ncbi:hypothetical protein M9Y10_038033 [Tritrichomonas musculus]|uniref:Protein kinase domain-containing protein n=1 Tax=Tritrichomonas musculus TaxID=1915356 RepID=A0ABR2K855_9EUKA
MDTIDTNSIFQKENSAPEHEKWKNLFNLPPDKCQHNCNYFDILKSTLESYKIPSNYGINQPNTLIVESCVKDIVSDQINLIYEKKKYFILIYASRIFLNDILDLSCYNFKLEELHKNEKFYILEKTQFYDHDLCVLCFSDTLHFFKIKKDIPKNYKKIMQKTYSKFVIRVKYIGSHKEEFDEKCSKIIVQPTKTNNKNENDEGENENQRNVVILPYFPIGTFESLIVNNNKDKNPGPSKSIIKLTHVDKFVMIYEIATALKDLHSNDEYHGNLSSQFIFINSSKDAYLELFCNDRSLERDSTKPRGPFYYRSPEILENEPITKADNLEDEEYVKLLQQADIYAFGVLMHEIITETSPERRMGSIQYAELLKILKGVCNIENQKYADNIKNYCDFLFKEGGGNEVFEDNYKDEEGNNFKGMKEIIEKCMKTETTERYSSFEEIIESLKALQIYINNKKEIDFRFDNARDADKYQCTISDLVESYYRGRTASKDIIEQFLAIYQKDLSKKFSIYQQNLSNNDENNYNEDIVKNILDIFPIKTRKYQLSIFFDISYFLLRGEERKISKFACCNVINDSLWFYLFDCTNNQNVKSLIQLFDIILSFYNIEEHKTQIYEESFQSNFTISFIIEEIIQHHKKYYFPFIYRNTLKFICDILIQKHQESKNPDYNLDDENKFIRKLNIFDKHVTSYKLYYDDNMNLYMKKIYNEYNDSISDDQKRREIEIIQKGLSKFIVHAPQEDSIQIKENMIPYYPIGDLSNLLKLYKLASVDKMVVILEIAIALRDLHLNKEYHGNLSSLAILINSSFDAYLFGFCKQDNEVNLTSLPYQTYYRPPENFQQNIFKSVEQQQISDIYSFGVLMHEIMTEISPKYPFQFKKLSKRNRLNILEGKDGEYKDYCDFLFKEGGGNEVFEDNYKDEEGNSFKGMKEIIEKCMKLETTERYSSFKELIGCIEALPIYTNNEEEIEFRIKYARDAREYQCTISDLVESYYRGQTESKDDIEQFLCAIIKDTIEIKDDTLNTILEVFGEKNNENFSFISHEYVDSKISNENFISHQFSSNLLREVFVEGQNLLSISLSANQKVKVSVGNAILKGKIVDPIPPVCSLKSFFDNNDKSKYEKYLYLWAYSIVMELSSIHSKNISNVDLSPEKIGIYYNHNTKTLLASFILYYIVCEKPGQSDDANQGFEKNRKKDVKRLKQFLENLQVLSKEVIESIKNQDYATIILDELYKFISKEVNSEGKDIFMKNYKCEYDYSDFQITSHEVKELFILFQKNGFSFKDLFVKFDLFFRLFLENFDFIVLRPKTLIINITSIQFDFKQILGQMKICMEECENSEKIARQVEELQALYFFSVENKGNKEMPKSQQLINIFYNSD